MSAEQATSRRGGPLIGRVIAERYRIEERIGSGGMGAVYRARHVKITRAFAIKLLHDDLITDDKMRRRFVREAELAGTLRHPNVIGVIDVGATPDGLHYIVMEYAEGPTLGKVMSDGPLAATRAVAIAKQLCDGLYHAHERGLIHRDFKPENVIVECDRDGVERPRIVDFGIAIVREAASSPERERLTTAGLILGTPHYMAPEHATDQAIDHRIDLFALGIIMFEMLTGALPYPGDGVAVASANILSETPAMADRAPGVMVDPLLEAFTRRLLAKSRDDRPPTAKAARDLLALITRDRPAAATQLGVSVSAGRYEVPHPVATPVSGQHAIPRPVTTPAMGRHAIRRPATTPVSGEHEIPRSPGTPASGSHGIPPSPFAATVRIAAPGGPQTSGHERATSPPRLPRSDATPRPGSIPRAPTDRSYLTARRLRRRRLIRLVIAGFAMTLVAVLLLALVLRSS